MPVLFESDHTPPYTGHTPRHTRQPPVTHTQELPRPRGPKFARFAALNRPPQLQQRMAAGTADHEYLSMLGQSTHGSSKAPHYLELPGTEAVPFEEEVVNESYIGEGSPDLNDSESEESVDEYQEPQLEARRPHGRDPFETSPEPHSLHSSISENYLKRAKMPLSRVRAEQRHRIQNAERFHRHFPINGQFESADHETQGTFTSAAPTPDSQKKVLLRPHVPKKEEADYGEQESKEQSVLQHAASRTESVQGSYGDAPEDIEPASAAAAGDISALTKSHKVALDRSPSHSLDTGGPEREKESGDSIVEDVGDSDRRGTPSFSSQPDAEQTQDGGTRARASFSSQPDAEQTQDGGTRAHERSPSFSSQPDAEQTQDGGTRAHERSPSFSSQPDAEQTQGGGTRAPSSEGDLQQIDESDAAAM